jgi:diguanylate cyclase (GGDEF)-like protein/PAS domain S-box-containing protein
VNKPAQLQQSKAEILIVDDDTQNMDVLTRQLQKHDYSVTTTDNGEHALEMIETRSFDLLLLDIMMPGISGYDVLKKVRQKYSFAELPIIMVTALQETEPVVESLLLGANDYITKPVNLDILKARIETQTALKQRDSAFQYIKRNLESIVMERTEELVLLKDELESERERYEYILNSSPTITYTTDIDKKHTCRFISANVYDLLGYEAEEMINHSTFWRNHVHPDDIESGLVDEIENNLAQYGGRVQYRFLHKDGTYHWISDRHHVVYKNKQAREVVGSWTDVTATKQLAEDLFFKSTHDELTGLVNRTEFEKRLGNVVSKLNSGSVEHVMCYMDLDQFKVINDTYGHTAGDELIRQLSEIFQKNLRHRDTLARLGGDEFGFLLEYCTLEQAQRALEEIQETISEFRFKWKDKSLSISASIGVVPVNTQNHDTTEIMSMADTACYVAKDAGRNRIHVFNKAEDGQGQRQNEMHWVERINRALEEDRLCLYAQPIHPIDGEHKEKHFELLIRMIGENGDIIPPGAFLPAAERYNLSSKIDYWVIKTAFSWLQSDETLLGKAYLWGINLSGQSLNDDGLIEFVIDQFERKDIPPERIYFEVTETAAIANMNNAVQFIKALQEKGSRFALDDFGSGLSSFAYLKNMPVDYLKIDGAFVKNLEHDMFDYAMVKAINDVGQAMKKQTIAEFVENDAILEKLKELGVDYAQGYGIGKPQPLNEIH